MLDKTALALLIILLVQVVKERKNLDKKKVGLVLILVGAVVGIINAAAILWMPPWIKDGVMSGVSIALEAGVIYGLVVFKQPKG